MFSVDKKHVDWSEEWEKWDISCPVCEGTGTVTSAEETWRDAPVDERVEFCQERDTSIFAARRDEPPEAIDLSQFDGDDLERWFSDLSEVDCEECNAGDYELMWNTAWKVGRQVSEGRRRKVDGTGCIVVFDSDGDAWLTLGGCGMDMTPHLCHAWLELGYTWLPLEWISSLLGNSGYIEACKPPEVAQKIRVAMDDTLNTAKLRIADMIEQNSEHLTVDAQSE